MDDGDWVEGVSGGCLEFDGVDDHVEITGYDVTGEGLGRTFSAWVRTAYQDGAIMWWGNGSGAGGLWSMKGGRSDWMFAVRVDGGYVRGSSRINTGGWVHVSAVLPPGASNAEDALLYVNGVMETRLTVGVQEVHTASEANFRIGADNDGGYFSGWIDDVRIYDRPLPAEEIAKLAE